MEQDILEDIFFFVELLICIPQEAQFKDKIGEEQNNEKDTVVPLFLKLMLQDCSGCLKPQIVPKPIHCFFPILPYI